MTEICLIKTTVGLDDCVYNDPTSARMAVEDNLNPELSRCGRLPGCRGCGIRNGAEVRAVAERVARSLPSRIEKGLD